MSTFTRRETLSFAAGTCIAAATGTIARAETVSAREISAYFNSLRRAKARFSQLNPDGSRSSGMFYIRRPGRMRFEYDGPQGSIMVAGGSKIAIIEDPSRSSDVKIYPLSQTPLWLLLKRNVDLASDKFVLGLNHTSNASVLTVHDPDQPQYGQMQLVFTPDPVTLRQWVVTTPQGERTTVVLGPLDTQGRIDSSLFDIQGLDDDDEGGGGGDN
ncbi:MAG: outer membrane lipoprotein carrier protein LolA [Pseudomonadota bacterium]